MNNRFGFKDLVFTVLLVVFIVSIFLAMKQADRQGETLRSIDRKLTEHTRELARIREALARGVAPQTPMTQTAPSPDATAQQPRQEVDVQQASATVIENDPFERIRQLREREDYATGDTLMQVFAQPPDRLTPIISSDAYASIIQSYVIETLAQRNADTLEWEPVLAERWEVTENLDAWRAYIDAHLGQPVSEEQVRAEAGYKDLADSPTAQADYLARRLEEGLRQEDIIRQDDAPTALTIRFHLRQAAQFSDGEPLTADDVLFTYNWIMNPQVEAIRSRVYYEPIRSVEKLSEHEVAFHFREPYFQAFAIAAGMEVLPEHFYGQYTPSAFNRHPALLLGSGPYRMPNPVSTRPQVGVPIELVRNERYWAEPSGFDRLVWRVIEQETSRQQAFVNREVDMFPATPEQYDRLRSNEQVMAHSQRFEFLRPNAGYNYIGWNQLRHGEPTPFADVRVRRAMTLLLDRERVAEEIYRGYAQVTSGPFSPLSKQYDPEIEPWPYDRAAGLKLLAEAGYQDRDGDGVLEGPDGKPFRFTINYPAGSDTYQLLAVFVRDSYRRAGIDASAQPLEWQVLIERLKNTRDFDAVALGWTGSLEGDPFQIFHSSTIPPPGDNAISYSNPKLDALLEKARMTWNEEERMPLWRQAHRIFHEDQPYTFMMFSKSLMFFDDRIRNVELTQTGLTPTVEWYVPAELQRR